MTPDIHICINVGASLITSVAFSRSGDIVASAPLPNSCAMLRSDGARQDMAWTWRGVAATLRTPAGRTPEISQPTIAVAVAAAVRERPRS